MFCPKCGAKIEDGAKFCPVCGFAVQDQPQQAPVQPPYPAPYPPVRPARNISIDAKTILYMAAAFLHLMVLIFWWIPSLGPKGDKYSLFKVFTQMKATFPAVLIIIFLILGFCILLYYALAPFIGQDPLKKFGKILKLTSIDMHLLTLFGTMTVMGPIKGFAGEVPVGFPIVFIYICLIAAILVEAYAYFVSEKKK
ncbi:MAG: zinc ribbon domain-containing protein [Clostridiales bacterium]|nr:zinc ribbon domain-containing protein [Clostridiales bacterium]